MLKPHTAATERGVGRIATINIFVLRCKGIRFGFASDIHTKMNVNENCFQINSFYQTHVIIRLMDVIPFIQKNIPFNKLSVCSRAIHCASDIPVQKGNSFLELV